MLFTVWFDRCRNATKDAQLKGVTREIFLLVHDWDDGWEDDDDGNTNNDDNDDDDDD